MRLRFSACCVLAVVAHLASADSVAVLPETSWSIATVLEQSSFQETVAGDRIVTERGALKGLELGARVDWQTVALQFSHQWFNDDVRYDGQTQLGQSFDSSSDYRIQQSTVDLLWAIPKSFHSPSIDELTPRLITGLGYRYWDRDIRGDGSVLGLREQYRWKFLKLGTQLRYRQQDVGLWLFDLMLLRPFADRIDVDFNGFAENVSLDQNARNSLRFAMTLQHPLNESSQLELSTYINTWKFQRSETKTTRTTINNLLVDVPVFQPANETTSIGLVFRIRL